MIITLIEYSIALFLAMIAFFAGWHIICLFILKIVNPVLTGLDITSGTLPVCRNTLGLFESFSGWVNGIDTHTPSTPNVPNVPDININFSPNINLILLLMLLAAAFMLTFKLLGEILKKTDFAFIWNAILKAITSIWNALLNFFAVMGFNNFFDRIRGKREQTKLKGLQHNSIFISYRRNDSADVVGRIYEKLTEYFGKDTIFMDVDSIRLGADFPLTLTNAVLKCKTLLAVIGDKWLEEDPSTGKSCLYKEGDFVRFEIESALMSKIPVIQLLVQGAKFPKADELPVSLKKLPSQNGIRIRPEPDFPNDMNRLIEELEGILKNRHRS